MSAQAVERFSVALNMGNRQVQDKVYLRTGETLYTLNNSTVGDSNFCQESVSAVYICREPVSV